MKTKIVKANVQEILELNLIQKGMLFHYLKAADQNLYNVQIALQVKGRLDKHLLELALSKVQEENEVLRSVFNWEKTAKPLQIILKKAPLVFTETDLKGREKSEKANAVDDLLEKDFAQRFDLEAVPLRLTLIRTEEDASVLVITHHHILYDGWSTGIFLKELFTAYHDLLKGSDRSAMVKPVYKEVYVRLKENNTGKEEQGFWKEYLKDCETTPLFENSNSDTTGSIKKISVDAGKTDLTGFSARNNVTAASVIYTAYGLLLQKYSNSEDVIFGTTVSGRDTRVDGIDQVIGNFINTIPLRINHTGPHDRMLDLVNRTQQQLIDRMPYEHDAYFDIKQQLGKEAGEDLFNSVVVIENYPLDERAINAVEGLSFELYSAWENTGIPVMITVYTGEKLSFELTFDSNQIDEHLMDAFSKHFHAVLDKIVNDSESRLESLNLLSEADNLKLLYEYNNTAKDYDYANILAKFRDQAALTPDNEAIRFGDICYSYAQLNNLSDQIALYLLDEIEIEKGEIVGLMLHREEMLIPAIYGIMKAGAVYMPLDPGFPQDRLDAIIEDSGVKVIISRKSVVRDSFQFSHELIDLDKELDEITGESTLEEPELPGAADTAYIIYTSGSTGKPKGVVISHGALANLVQSMDDRYPLGPSDKFLLKTSISFDISMSEIFGWFTAGGSLVIAEPDEEKNPSAVINRISESGITHINFVPSMFAEFVKALENGKAGRIANLKYVILCGEALPQDLANRFVKLNLDIRFLNIYGPTEATIYSSAYEITAESNRTGAALIGKPLENYQLYIMNELREFVPQGVAGELYIAGKGLADGYYRNESLTADRFVENPYIQGNKMYRTGDLVRMNSDGDIAFIGRTDYQVKVRGYRIELGDIESNLSAHEAITLCAVTVFEKTGVKELVAYYQAEEELSFAVLQNFLAAKLPAYMIPTYFVHLDEFPLTSNGKLNRKNLPSPKFDKGNEYVAPANENEEKLVYIWSEILSAPAEKIGTQTSFFEIGGHSLKAISLVNSIHKVFEVQISVMDIFEHRTIRQLSIFISNAGKSAFADISVAAEASHYSLSSAQRRLYFIYEFDKTTLAYNMPQAFEIKGKIDRQRLEKTFNSLIERHESLRASIELVDGEPKQKILPFRPVVIEDFEAKHDQIPAILKEFVRAFKLHEGYLLRAGLVKISDEEHALLLDTHHIIGDGVSNAILIREFIELYEGNTLEETKFQYKDFAEWQLSEATQKLIEDQKEFWLQNFKGDIVDFELPTDHSRPMLKSYRGGTFYSEIDTVQTGQLRELAGGDGTTLFMVLLAAYNVLISKLSGSEEVIVGTPVSGRSHTDLEKILGMFVNMLPLKNLPNGAMTFRQFLQDVKERTLRCIDHSDYQYEDLIDDLNLARDTSRNPLFDLIFMLQTEDEPTLKLPGLEINPQPTHHMVSKFDMTLTAFEEDDKLKLEIIYAKDLFNEDTIARFMSYYTNIINSILSDPDRLLSDIDMLPEADRHLLIDVFNNTAHPYSGEKTLVNLIEEQVAKTPENIALVTDTEEITYSELNAKANRLAHYLRKQGVERNDFVCIVQDRDIDMIVSILAIHKAGGAYVGLEPALPDKRIGYVLDSLNISFVLTNSSNANKVLRIAGETEVVRQVICHQTAKDDFGHAKYVAVSELTEESADNPVAVNIPEDNAYAIFTSGSTGKPKGVLVKHKPVINLVEWVNTTYQVTEQDRVLFVSSISFDLSVYDIFGMLSAGGSLMIVPTPGVTDPPYLIKTIYDKRVTFWDSAPAVLNQLPNFFDEFSNSLAHKLRIVFLSGDWIPLGLPDQMKGQFPGVHVVGLGGATEATIWSNFFNIGEVDPEWKSIPYGEPIWNARYYVLDKYLKPCAFDVAGDLYIGGECLATCYLNDPELSAQKFIEDPYNPGGKMYKTGDMATWHENGYMEFLGRKDFQVKVNGYRIELGEIESVIDSFDAVKESIVLVRTNESRSQYIVAYFVSDTAIDTDTLRKYLTDQLPAYMVPSYFIQLDQMPLNANGKIDRKALPEPDTSMAGQEYTEPENSREELLQSLWQKILGKPQVSTTANFFELGGDSIKTIQIASLVRKHGYTLEIRDVYQHATIRELSKKLKESQNEVSNVVVTGQYDLLPVQQWYFENVSDNVQHFHQSVRMISKERLDIELLKKTVAIIYENHDVLRTKFSEENVAEILPVSEVKPIVRSVSVSTDMKEDYIARCREEIHAVTDLSSAPLVNWVLFNTPEQDILFISAHHLIIDNVSWSVMLDDFGYLYDSLAKGNEAVLPSKTTSYKDWAIALEQYATGQQTKAEAQLWHSIDRTQADIIPHDYQSGRGNTMAVACTMLSQEHTTQLLEKSSQAFGTEPKEILIAALYKSLLAKHGIRKLKMILEGHGREDLSETTDLSRTVGWFTAIYPVLLQAADKADEDILCSIKETLRGIPNGGIGYGVMRYFGKDEILSSAESPVLSFNYLGKIGEASISNDTIDMQIEMGGLDTSEDQKNIFEINFISYVRDGRLQIDVEYDDSLYRRETVVSLLDDYRQQINNLVEVCLNTKQRIFTPSDLTFSSLTGEEVRKLSEAYEFEDVLPLTPLQEGVMFHHLFDTSGAAYFQQFSFDVNNPIDISKVEAALQQVFTRNQSLRASFTGEYTSKPVQVIRKSVQPSVAYKDLITFSEGERNKMISEFTADDRRKGFDLAKDQLLRLMIFRTGHEQFRFVWSFHHIIIDAWSLGIVFREFVNIYKELNNAPHEPLAEPISFSRYLNWLKANDAEEQYAYWKAYLDDYSTTATVPVMSATEQSYENAQEDFTLGQELTAAINEYTGKHQITTNTFIQTIWGLVLSRLNRTDDVVFGSVVSGRNESISGVESLVGLLINTIPVRIRMEKEESFSELVRKVQEEAIGSLPHHNCSLAEIQAQSVLKNNLIDNIIVFENAPLDERMNADGFFRLSDIKADEEINYNLGLIIVPGEQLRIKIQYNSNVYSNAYVREIYSWISTMIGEALNNPSVAVNDLNILSEDQVSAILANCSGPVHEFDEQPVIYQFAESRTKYADRKAVVFENQTMSYDEFGGKADQVASYLIEQHNIQKGDKIAVLMERQMLLLPVIYGIMKAGAVYVPVDPKHPVGRIRSVIEESKASIVIAGDGECVSKAGKQAPCIDLSVASDKLTGQKILSVFPDMKPDDLAYVIFTSGSTGKPKGVMIRHSSLSNIIQSLERRYPLLENDNYLLKTSYTFDVSIAEIFGWFANGGSVTIATPGAELDPEVLLRTISENRVTHLNFVPSMFAELTRYLESEGTESIQSLKYIFLAGEALPPELVKRFRLLNDQITVDNIYGPTEGTIYSSAYAIPKDQEVHIMPIGQPIDNGTLYVTDHNGRLMPEGLPGELCIGGKGLAAGYLYNPALTAEKFTDNPFGTGKIYRTGDLVRRNNEGDIEFLGRIDDQVKIRGFRIELGEIESHLNSFPSVEQAVVTVYRSGGNDYLVAYYGTGAEIPDTQIRGYLADRLPGYMIPSFYIAMPSLPLNSNGKVDRRQLPDPEMNGKEEYRKASTAIQGQLTALWSEILDRPSDEISTAVSFFEIGGHSLKAMELNNKIHKKFGLRINMQSFFENPTILDLERFINVSGISKKSDKKQVSKLTI